MKKKIIYIIFFILILGLGFIFWGYSKEERKTDWNPPIQKLLWGMTMDDVKEVLDCKDAEIFEQNKVTYMSIKEKHETIYKIKMSLILSFDKDMGLIGFEGICDESDIPKLKDKLEEKYGAYRSGQQSSNRVRWNCERVIDLKNYEELMNHLFDRFGSQPEYDSLKQGFESSPLVYVELIEAGARKGTLIVNGSKQVNVNSLENPK